MADLVMLENIRFEDGETSNDPALAARLGALADGYVNDAFGSAHRAHASTEGVVHHVERAVAGLLFQREVETLGRLLDEPERPLVAVLGGAKAGDKIGVISRFLEVADSVLLGGGMSYPFFAVGGSRIGRSLCDDAGLEAARTLLAAGGAKDRLRLPVDLVTADRFSADAELRVADPIDIDDDWEAIDIGPRTRELVRRADRRRRHGVLERARRRVRDRAVRRRHARDRRAPSPTATRSPSSAAATRARR